MKMENECVDEFLRTFALLWFATSTRLKTLKFYAHDMTLDGE